MLKLGCNAMLRDSQNPGQHIDVEKLIHFIGGLDLDAIDFHAYRGFASKEPDYLLHIKRLCLKYGLPVSYIGIGAGFAGMVRAEDGRKLGALLPREELRARVQEAKEGVDMARFLGAPMIRLFAGRVLEESEQAEQVYSQMIESFQAVADYARERGVFVGLHNHEPPAAPRGEDLLRILKDADRDNITIIMDTGRWWGSIGVDPKGNPDPDANIYEYMEQVAPYATVVRTKIYRIDSGKEEWLNYERIFKILKSVSFNGNLSIVYEGFNNRCDDFEGIRLAVKHLRDVIERTMA